MNQIDATVTQIQSVDNITIVSFKSHNEELRMMALGLNLPIEVGSRVVLGTKASSIALAKEFSGMISFSNQLTCEIESINKGSLLCSVKLNFNGVILESIITVASASKMELEVGQRVIALIKASELSILTLK